MPDLGSSRDTCATILRRRHGVKPAESLQGIFDPGTRAIGAGDK
jgi:hypothetical protein